MTKVPAKLAYGPSGTLQLEPARALLSFHPKKKGDTANLDAVAKKLGLVVDSGKSKAGSVAVNHTGRQRWLRSPDGKPIEPAQLERGRFSLNPVYRVGSSDDADGLLAIRVNALVVLPASDSASKKLNKLIVDLGFELDDRFAVLRPYRYYSASSAKAAPSIGLRQLLLEKHAQLLRSVQFDVVPYVSPVASSASPVDRLFTGVDAGTEDFRQWYLRAIDPSAPIADPAADGGIDAPTAWVEHAAGTGAAVKVALIDNGVEIAHPNLVNGSSNSLFQSGGNTGLAISSLPPSSGVEDPDIFNTYRWHGTAMAGLVAARFDGDDLLPISQRRIAGLGRSVELISLATYTGSSADLAAGIAAATAGTWEADIILVGMVSNVWMSGDFDFDMIATNLDTAFADGKIIVVPAGNSTSDTEDTLKFPAAHPGVIACAASNRRKDWALLESRHLNPGPLAEIDHQASRYGNELSVTAPGEDITTLDLTGMAGRNVDAGSGFDPLLGTDNISDFGGTSAAAALVAGTAALLVSTYPDYPVAGDVVARRDAVKRILERTADMLPGPAATPYKYIDVTREWVLGAPPHARVDPWHEESGFGRINAGKALTFADVMIRERPDDVGEEPYTYAGVPGGPDMIVSTIDVAGADPVRPTEAEFQAAFGGTVDDTFDVVRNDYNRAGRLEEGNENYLYMRVKNLGPAVATNVVVKAVLASCAMGFDYPEDYNQAVGVMTGDYLAPPTVTFPTLAVGEERIAKISVVVPVGSPHLCLLGSVRSDNDHAFENFHAFIVDALTDPMRANLAHGQSYSRNNLVQKNLSLVNLIPPPPPPAPGPAPDPDPGPGSGGGAGKGFRYGILPFILGTRRGIDRNTHLVVEVEHPEQDVRVRVALDDGERHFVDRVNFKEEARRMKKWAARLDPVREDAFEFLAATRIRTKLAGILGELAIAPGTLFGAQTRPRLEPIDVDGGRVVLENRRRYLEVPSRRALVRLEKDANQRYPIALEARVPAGKGGRDIVVHLREYDERGNQVGDQTVVFQHPRARKKLK